MLFNFGCVQKLEALEGVFQNRITGKFLFLAKECNLDKGFYDYQNITQKWMETETVTWDRLLIKKLHGLCAQFINFNYIKAPASAVAAVVETKVRSMREM